jgi:hypothetical protein
MKEYYLVKDGSTIRTDWRLPLLECIRDRGKITDRKVKRQVLKYCEMMIFIRELLTVCC